MFYVDSGGSDHLIPSRDNLHAYQKFAKPVKISAANGRTIYAYGSGTLGIATSANSLGREADIQDVYYGPEAHGQLVSLGKLEGQGWDVRLSDGTMEPRDRDGDLSAKITKARNDYPVKLNVILPKAGFTAWTTEGEDPTHDELVERLRLGKVEIGGRGKRCRRHESDADELAPTAGSPVFQDWGGVSRERRRRCGHNGPAEEDTQSCCICCEIGTPLH